MAELATIARPYAEALLKASANGDAASLAREIRALADVAANPQLRQFADSPKIDATQIFDLLTGVAGTPSGAPLSDAAKNLLRTVIDNGRLVALPEIAAQFQALGVGQTLGRVGPGRGQLFLDALVGGRQLGLGPVGGRQAFADLLGTRIERGGDRRPDEPHREQREDHEDDHLNPERGGNAHGDDS